MTCSSPPSPLPGQTFELLGNGDYTTQAMYTCGPLGEFFTMEGEVTTIGYSVSEKECQWSGVYTPEGMDKCRRNIYSHICRPDKVLTTYVRVFLSIAKFCPGFLFPSNSTLQTLLRQSSDNVNLDMLSKIQADSYSVIIRTILYLQV